METIGIERDRVTLKLGDSELFLATSYSTIGGVFDVPAAYTVSIGVPADKLSAVLQVTRPHTTCELAIDGNVQFRGFIDERQVSTTAQGTTFTLNGRDQLEELFDRYITAERTFTDLKLVELVTSFMDEVYFDGYELQYNADVARRMMTGDESAKGSTGASGGIKIALPTLGGEESDPLDFEQNIADANKKKPKASKILDGRQITLGQLDDPDAVTLVVPMQAVAKVNSQKLETVAEFRTAINFLKAAAKAFKSTPGPPPKPTVTAKIGERMFDGVIKPELDRAGYFLWSAGPGIFVLAAPNVTQTPTTRIIRRLNGRNEGSAQIVSAQFRDGSVRRYSSVTVHAKSGSGAKSRTFKDGTAVDLEMMDLGYMRPMAIQDAKCKTDEQAIALAKRKIAEARRSSWSLTYTLSGHTTLNTSGKRVVWAFDTTVEIIDEILGIEGVFYVDTVEHSGQPQKTTRLKLMRPADALFGDGSGTGADS